MPMHGGGGERKRKLQLDFESLLDGDDDDDPSLMVVMAGREEDESDQCLTEMSDKELIEKIGRLRNALGPISSKLPDGGKKLRASLKKAEVELEKRKLSKDDKKVISIADEYNCNGTTNDFSHHGAPPHVPASRFALHFRSKLDDQMATKCFEEELCTLNHSDHKNIREHTPSVAQRAHKTGSSSRQVPFKSPRHLSMNSDILPRSNCELSGSHSSPCQHNKDVPVCFGKKNAYSYGPRESSTRHQPPPTSRRNNLETLVLIDEEDELEVDIVDKAEQVGQSNKEIRVYYPSRDDPKAVEICYSDMECLAPESYLSSPIMNFYIRYLQKSTSPMARKCDYHIFNTYFYEKLKQDVLTKVDKETSFKKFRRWWKGVNIFEKAYIFLPIHENLHWSLAIISVPNKEEESGPIILHLDSLGWHTSKSIFNNVKSFLIEEWKFLRQEEVLPELPIPDNIWDKLSRRIGENVIQVPQQKNDYDCGLFVLFFMERFLEEAPERLTKQDLEMFGRQWFKPEEASSLRRKIRDLLQEEFKMQMKAEYECDS